MKSRTIGIGAHAALVVLAIVYGMSIVKFHLPPYRILRGVYHSLRPPPYPGTPQEYAGTDVEGLISIASPDDAARARSELVALLWGAPGLPTAMPAVVDEGVADERFRDLPSLDRVDELTVAMEFGLDSHAFHFIPRTPNGRVVLYHHGHGDGFGRARVHIGEFLERGYSVVELFMPLFGPNDRPVVSLPRFGPLELTSHEQMKFLSPPNGHPVKFFVEPVVVVLNYLEAEYEYTSATMIGFSGGGWTTVLAAAVDPRIRNSYPVAGSYPVYLRSGSPRDWADYEQTVPELYRTANYLELYVLGSYGQGRRQVQVVNRYDPCCFAGTKWKTYAGVVAARVRDLGLGSYEVFLDESHKRHAVSDAVVRRILVDLSGA